MDGDLYHGKAKEVLGLIATAQSEGRNPLEAVNDFLWRQLVPKTPDSLRYQLYGISAVLGICLMFVLVSLAMRLFQGNGAFWIIRVSDSGLLTPHWSIGWSLWAVILLAFLQAQIFVSTDYLKGEHVVPSYFALRCFPWITSFLGGWTAVWSLSISYCTHRNASGKLALDTRTAVVLNTLAIAVPVVYLAAALPFAIKTTLTWSKFIAGFAELDHVLKMAALAYDADPSSFSILSLASQLPGLQEFYATTDSLVWQAQRVFIVFAISGVFLITVSYLHLRSLSRVIRETTSILHTLESSRSREHALLRSYQLHRALHPRRRVSADPRAQNLKWTSISFILIDAIFTGLCSYIAVKTRQAFTDSVSLQVDLLGPLYLFCVFGLPTALLLLVRALDSLDVHKTNHSSSTRGKLATSIGVGGKSHVDNTPVFEMVVPRREYTREELDDVATKEAEAQARPQVQRDADGWFRQVQHDAESRQEAFSAGATPSLSEQERRSMDLSRSESVSTKRHTGRSSLWLSSGSNRWSNRDEK